MKRHWIIALLFGGLALVVGFCFLISNVYYNRGMKQMRHSSLERAEKEFRMAIRLNPLNAEAHYRLSFCICTIFPIPKVPSKDNMIQEIEKEVRWTIRLKPNYAEAHYRLGTILSDQGKKEEAVQEFRNSLRLNPYEFHVHWDLGKLYWELGKPEEAEKEYREAIRLKPNEIKSPYLLQESLVTALMVQGKYTEAEQEARSIPEDRGPHFYLGRIFDKQGKFAEAEKEYREAIKLNPDDYWIYGDLGIVLAREGKFKAAEDTILKGFRCTFYYSDLYYQLGCCYALWGKKEKAIVSLQKAADKGFYEWPNMEKDTLLNEVHGDPRFNKIAEKVKENWERFQNTPPP